MPKYRIQTPDGRVVTSEAPDEATAIQGTQEWYRNNPKPEAPERELSGVEKIADVGTSFGSGAVKGTMDLATLPADAATLAAAGARRAGLPEEYIQATKGVVDALPGNPLALSRRLRTARQDKDGVMGAINDYSNYTPVSRAGRYAKTVGEFAPGAIGGGGVPATALRFAKYAALPGVASERAGEMFAGQPGEGIARGAGALLGLGGGAALNRLGERIARGGLRTADDFERIGHNAYEELKQSRVFLRNTTVDNFQAGLAQHLDDIGFLPGNEQKASNVLNDIWRNLRGTNSQVLAGRGAQTGFGQRPMDLSEFDKIGSKLMRKIKDLHPDDHGDRRILWATKHYLDDFIQQLDQGQVIAGDIPRGLEALRTARANWRQKSKLELLDEMEESANRTGTALYTRGGEEHANRTEFLKFLRKNPNKRQGLTEQELEEFERVVSGTPLSNAARGIGKLGSSATGNFYSTGVGATAGYFLGGPLGLAAGFAVPAASMLARMYSKAATRKAVNNARSMIANGERLRRPYKSMLGKLHGLNQALNQ